VLAEIGATLALLRVVGDSRCPRDVLCVWAGEVIVELEWSVEGAAPEAFRMAGFPPIAHPVGSGHTISLVRVDPYPEQRRRFDPSVYVVTVNVAETTGEPGPGPG
jgi:hypothetical protein